MSYSLNATKKRGCTALLSHFIKYCEEIRLLPLPAAAKHNRGWSALRSGCSVTLPALYYTLLEVQHYTLIAPQAAATFAMRRFAAV